MYPYILIKIFRNLSAARRRGALVPILIVLLAFIIFYYFWKYFLILFTGLILILFLYQRFRKKSKRKDDIKIFKFIISILKLLIIPVVLYFLYLMGVIIDAFLFSGKGPGVTIVILGFILFLLRPFWRWIKETIEEIKIRWREIRNK